MQIIDKDSLGNMDINFISEKFKIFYKRLSIHHASSTSYNKAMDKLKHALIYFLKNQEKMP